MYRKPLGGLLAASLIVVAPACAHAQRADSTREALEEPRRESVEERLARETEALRAALPPSPAAATAPRGGTSLDVFTRAIRERAPRIVISVVDRALWYMSGDSVLFAGPVAVGRTEDLEWAGRTYDFDTPPGIRKVLDKATDPLWTPPDWHYFELAVEHGLTPVQLEMGKAVTLADGSRIEIRGKDVGRVNQFGNFWPFTPGSEIMFDDRIFIPPFGTNQRRVPEILGTHKLELGDGYLIHGTNQDDSIGAAVSHGCVRMFNGDVAWLHDTVPVGTSVYIF